MTAPYISTPFANSGDFNNIPVPAPGAGDPSASYTLGFPPITSIPAGAGGKAPNRQDFNGILRAITQNISAWQQGTYPPFNAAFVAAIGGYPQGAIIGMASGGGLWVNNVVSNTNNPETTAPGTSGWVPLVVTPGNTATVSLSNADVTLSAAQALNQIIILNGNISANIAVTLPPNRIFMVINGTVPSASFAITVKNPNGQSAQLRPSVNAMPQWVYVGPTSVYVVDGSNGTQTVQVTGYASPLLTSLQFSVNGGVVSYCLPPGNTNTAVSNGTTLAIGTGGKLTASPRTPRAVPVMLQDNGADAPGWALVATDGQVSFGLGATPNYSGFTASGQKGFGTGFTLTYPL